MWTVLDFSGGGKTFKTSKYIFFGVEMEIPFFSFLRFRGFPSLPKSTLALVDYQIRNSLAKGEAKREKL